MCSRRSSSKKETAIGEDVRASLLRRRLVLLDRRIDGAAANATIAQLLLLEAQDQLDEIRLVVNANGGELTAGLALHDVVRRCAAPVATMCFGQAAGVAVLALSGGTPGRRFIAPAARVKLELGQVEATGRVADIQAWQHELEALTLRFARAVADDCGRHLEEVEHDLHQGRLLDADAAKAYGLVDAILEAGDRLT